MKIAPRRCHRQVKMATEQLALYQKVIFVGIFGVVLSYGNCGFFFLFCLALLGFSFSLVVIFFFFLMREIF
jgi:hypothetical protein